MIQSATLKLFKALPITSETSKLSTQKAYANTRTIMNTLSKGYVLAPEIYNEYSVIGILINEIDEVLGLSGAQMNATLHKSWNKVKNASMYQLVLEQCLHYITTYGFEALGIYDESTVYFPYEKLEVPAIELTENLQVTIIRGLTKSELKARVLKLLQSGIALHEDTIKDVVTVCNFVGIDTNDLMSIKNKEVSIILYEQLKLVPRNPTEFIRYIVYKSTSETLLIKNRKLLGMIKASTVDVTYLFERYAEQVGLEHLARIFNRYKPYFLAFKRSSATPQKMHTIGSRVPRSLLRTVYAPSKAPSINTYINKIRKLSKKYHAPMKRDYLNDVTSLIKSNKIDGDTLAKALIEANIFRKIRLAYALRYRTKNPDSILYKVRNGKGYAKAFSFDAPLGLTTAVYNMVTQSIINDMKKKVDGKVIYIPEGLTYALPATEKQFTGNVPSGTCVEISEDMLFGVHWENTKGHRIDLDLSLMNAHVGKIGWDSSYRTSDRSIMFSGDVTDARGKNGASEVFFVQKGAYGNYLMQVNYYNYSKDVPVPYTLFVAKEKPRGGTHSGSLKNNYMVNPNNIVGVAKSKITDKQHILGLLESTREGCKFYYVQTAMGHNRSAKVTGVSEMSRKYLFNYYGDTISLNDILIDAGATIVTDPNTEGIEIDLSPQALTKDTIISLITPE